MDMFDPLSILGIIRIVLFFLFGSVGWWVGNWAMNKVFG